MSLFLEQAAKARDELCERRHLFSFGQAVAKGGHRFFASRFLALLSRTLFALLRMPRVPEGASAIYGARAGILAAGPVMTTLHLRLCSMLRVSDVSSDEFAFEAQGGGE